MILIHKECVFSCFFRKIEDKKKNRVKLFMSHCLLMAYSGIIRDTAIIISHLTIS